MRKPLRQFSLKLVLAAMAAIAYHMALFANLLHGSLAGFVATLLAHAMVWLAVALYRMRHWPVRSFTAAMTKHYAAISSPTDLAGGRGG